MLSRSACLLCQKNLPHIVRVPTRLSMPYPLFKHNKSIVVFHFSACLLQDFCNLLYTCKCLLNTLGRAVEQLAGCFAKETKVSSQGQSTTVMQRRT